VQGMGKVIQFKSKESGLIEDAFLDQLNLLEQMYLQGIVDKIFIIAKGSDVKACTSNSLKVREGKELCHYFINNCKDYT
jgi:hypothetical protein